MIKILQSACLAAVFIAVSAAAQDHPQIKAAATPAETTIGSIIKYQLTITGASAKGLNIVLPDKKVFIPDEDKKKNEVRKNKKKDTAKKPEDDDTKKVPLYIIHNAKKEDRSDKDISYINVIVEISYYRPGKHPLPEIEIYGEDRIRIGYQIPEITVKALNEQGELQDIEPPLDMGGNYWRLVIIAAALLAAGAGIFFLLSYFKKRRMRPAEPEPPVPPLDIFMVGIKSLKGKKLIESGKYEEFVLGLSLLFRKFISARYGFDAMEMTGSEMIAALKNCLSPMTFSRYSDDFQNVINLWDLTKFAEFMPSGEAMSGNMDETIKLAKRLSA
jgi:hypothetical protein